MVSAMSGNHTQEFLKFLRRLDEEFPGDIPALGDGKLRTHKHPRTGGWLKRSPSLHLSLWPTSSSWPESD